MKTKPLDLTLWKSLVTLAREAIVELKSWKSDGSGLKRVEGAEQSSDCRQRLLGSLRQEAEKCGASWELH